MARVKAHLARYERLINSNAEENEVIEIRGLKIDTTARRVWVGGEERSFTTKEFDLLTFWRVIRIMCIRRRAVSRDLGYGVDSRYRDCDSAY